MDSQQVAIQDSRVWWGPWDGLGIAVVAYILPQIVAVLVASGLHLNIEDQSFGTIIITSLIEILSLGVVMGYVRSKSPSLAALGLRLKRVVTVFWAIPTYVAYFIVTALSISWISRIFPKFNADESQNIPFSTSMAGPLRLGIVFFILVLLVPITEEIMFRGFLYKGFKKKVGPVYAAVVTSALFGLAHFQWNISIDTCILSFFLIYLYEKTESLWPSIALHAIKNSLAFLVLFIYKP